MKKIVLLITAVTFFVFMNAQNKNVLVEKEKKFNFGIYNAMLTSVHLTKVTEVVPHITTTYWSVSGPNKEVYPEPIALYTEDTVTRYNINEFYALREGLFLDLNVAENISFNVIGGFEFGTEPGVISFGSVFAEYTPKTKKRNLSLFSGISLRNIQVEGLEFGLSRKFNHLLKGLDNSLNLSFVYMDAENLGFKFAFITQIPFRK